MEINSIPQNNPNENGEYETYEMNYVSTVGQLDEDMTGSIDNNENSTRQDNRPVLILTTKQDMEKTKLTEDIKRINYGNMNCCLFYKNDPLIAIGPNYFYFIILTLVLFSIHSSIFLLLQKRILKILRYTGHIIYLIQVFSYTFTTLKNPGIPSFNNQNYARNETINGSCKYKTYSHCSMCNSYVPVDSDEITFHCADCDVCIEGYDHHCVWTSKCVGKGNLKIFYLFAISTLTYIIFTLIAVIWSFL